MNIFTNSNIYYLVWLFFRRCHQNKVLFWALICNFVSTNIWYITMNSGVSRVPYFPFLLFWLQMNTSAFMIEIYRLSGINNIGARRLQRCLAIQSWPSWNWWDQCNNLEGEYCGSASTKKCTWSPSQPIASNSKQYLSPISEHTFLQKIDEFFPSKKIFTVLQTKKHVISNFIDAVVCMS